MIAFNLVVVTDWQDVQVPFVAVLDRFDAQEHRGTDHRDQNQLAGEFVLSQLSSANGPRHRQTAEQQHDRVETTEDLVEEPRGIHENFRVVVPVQGVSHKQTAEEQDFGDQENPNTEFSGIKLLFRRIEVVRDELTMIVMIIVMVVVAFSGCINR